MVLIYLFDLFGKININNSQMASFFGKMGLRVKLGGAMTWTASSLLFSSSSFFFYPLVVVSWKCSMTTNWAYLEKNKHSWIPTKAAPPKAESPDLYHPEAWKAFKKNCRVDSIQVLKMWTIGTMAGLEAASEKHSTFRETESTAQLLQVKETLSVSPSRK